MLRSTLHRLPLISAALLFGLLFGCAGVSSEWNKPSATEAQVKADNAACRDEAEQVYGVTANITHDIRVSRPGGRTNVDRQSDDIRNSETVKSYDTLFGACMAARGYRKSDGTR